MTYMKSKVIKVRNLSDEKGFVQKTVHVKPHAFLYLILFASILLYWMRPYLAGLCASMFLLSAFALLVMPDRKLVQFTSDYMILYNCEDNSECMLAYYEDIVSWRYEWHANVDLLVLSMVDGSTETQEMYSRWSIMKYMKLYAAGKEEKNRRKKGLWKNW